MQKFNRGEWSEFYGILYLLVKPNLNVVDSDLKTLDEALYIVKKVIVDSQMKLKYEIVNDSIFIFVDEENYKTMKKDDLEKNRIILLNSILSAKSKKGSFSIPSIDSFLSDFTKNNILKSKSKNKSDVEINVDDKKLQVNKNLSYSIKSCLGSPATILNSSSCTNFEYIVENFNPQDIQKVNSINSRTKLVDRIKMIESLNGKIKFNKILSETFEYNLKMVDSNMPSYIGNTLLYSYKSENKNLSEIFLNANNFSDSTIGLKKLGDFLSATSFGFIPSEKWNGKNSVTGGLLIVKENGDVVILDLIYYKDEVIKYLINSSRLDSPSSSRYHMLELEEKNGKIYFTLNLQVRYK